MKERLQQQLEEAIRALLAEAGDAGEIPAVALEIPRQKEHGDFACNAALLLAKRLGRKPREIAEALVEALGDAGGLVDRAEVAGPGFVNLWLAGDRWRDVLRGILEVGRSYGGSDEGAGVRVQVEFVSANPTGPLSTGHGRQAVLGDCIARLLEFRGFDVTREYYFNNGGRQMRVLGQSVKARYLEALGVAAPPPAAVLADPEKSWVDEVGGLPVQFPADGYQGDYIVELAEALCAEHGDALVGEPAEAIFREVAEKQIFAGIRATLDALGIHFDVYSNEKTLYDEGKLDAVLEDLRAVDLIYESEGAVWLRGTTLGLDRDRVMIRSSGEPTYLLPDIAYHREKMERGFDVVVDVMGADHIDQFPFVREAMSALGYDAGRIEMVMHQFVTLTRAGRKVKQSTRKATIVTADDLLEEVGGDVFRFFMIERRADGHLDFDLDLATERNWNKNPAYYVQYAVARTHGIERTAADAGLAMPGADDFDADRLNLPEELEVMKKLGEFPELVARAAAAREPHHLAYYLRDLAGLWNPYLQDGTRHRVVSDDAGRTAARLGLVLAVRTVLTNGLALLGIAAPERM
ncbi:MAG: arginine--tRNA ligase [Proteobacteria bacterium]|nr:arginine--tRNA ligase [Pseudomonadota bacterium]